MNFPDCVQILDIKLIENLHLAPLKSAMACPSEPKLTDLQMLVMRHRPDLQAIFNISDETGHRNVLESGGCRTDRKNMALAQILWRSVNSLHLFKDWATRLQAAIHRLMPCDLPP